MTQISKEEIQKATEGIVAFMLEKTEQMTFRGRVIFIYNNAMDDAVAALEVYAEKNVEHGTGLRAAASELRRNFKLAEEQA